MEQENRSIRLRVLRGIASEPGILGRELIVRIGLSEDTIVRHTNALAADGLITKHRRPDGMKPMFATAAGQQAIQEGEAA